MQVWALIVDAFRDARDRKVFWIMLFMSAAVAAAMACIGFTDRGIDLMFGMWQHDLSEWSANSTVLRANVTAVMIDMIADNYLGWIGMIVALIATASIFPSLIETGNIDIVASKPISRGKLFLSRYLGAMVFMGVQATAFVVLTFLVMGVRWHQWVWAYFWLVPLTVLLFSYLFAFCALFGVIVRRSMTALILTLVAWFMLFAVQTTHVLLQKVTDAGGKASVLGSSGDRKDESSEVENSPQAAGKWLRIVSAVRWIIPKTQDVPVIASKLVGARNVLDAIPFGEGEMSPEDRKNFLDAAERQKRHEATVDPFTSIASSLAAEFVVVLLAMWRFNRRDF